MKKKKKINAGSITPTREGQRGLVGGVGAVSWETWINFSAMVDAVVAVADRQDAHSATIAIPKLEAFALTPEHHFQSHMFSVSSASANSCSQSAKTSGAKKKKKSSPKNRVQVSRPDSPGLV